MSCREEPRHVAHGWRWCRRAAGVCRLQRRDNTAPRCIRLKGELRERYQFVYGLFPRLAERRRQSAGTLSGGEQQMLAIGRALMSGRACSSRMNPSSARCDGGR